MRSRTLRTRRHRTHYLECGDPSAPLMIFLHGWPSLSVMWRAHLTAFAADGWRCLAPDLRGYGRSSAPSDTDAYAMAEIVADMVELHEHVGGSAAVWVGHDWGCVVAAQLAAHEPERSRAVVLTNLAYQPHGHALATVVPLVDRTLYPEQDYPDGQWDYYRFYTTHFSAAVAELNADVAASLASILRPGDPGAVGQVSPTAVVTRNGGRFGDVHRAPPIAPDSDSWRPADFDAFVESFSAHGFRSACAWYLNDAAAIAYAGSAARAGRLSQPVLFVNGDFDQTCTIVGNRQGDPMRAACDDLTLVTLPAGHWLPMERPTDHIDAIRRWLTGLGLAAGKS